ncbi:MAG: Type I phosphodiesterase/nucleotide pyrophosphatase [Thermococcales archaeon 44_46]|nr:MAG: Type I phosphodiesterase/nucleotide pyrophosphatase [Thermococcales archaeon 44_46]
MTENNLLSGPQIIKEGKRMKKPKVIVVGLDGATWDLIIPLVKKGELPTFEMLLRNSAWGRLKSTIPPVTFPAWHSLFTGKNPGKLGVYNFVQVDVSKHTFKINTPYSFSGNPIWKILSDKGYKSCIINVPTAKVERINGVIVGGPFSDKLVYPQEYEELLNSMNYEQYPEKLTKLGLYGKEKPSPELIEEVISSRFNLARLLIEKEHPDFLVVTIFTIDNIQHFYWGDEIVNVAWKIIDKQLGNFLAEFMGHSYILLVSDHGFSEGRGTFYISKFLTDHGLIRYKRPIIQRITSRVSLDKILGLGIKLRLSKLAKYLPQEKLLEIISIFQDKGGRLGAKGLEKVIDWENSFAIPIDNLIYLNGPEEQKTNIKLLIKEELEKLPIINKVFLKEDIYWGNFVNSAPDLVIMPQKGVDVLENPSADKLIENKIVRSRWKAVHELYGIFLINGPNVEPKKELKANIYDIAPTILYLFGLPPDPDMDGRILYEVFKKKQANIDKDYTEKLRIKHKIKALRDKL